MQTTNTVLMVRPSTFASGTEAQVKALKEFDDFVIMLRQAGIVVIEVEDLPTPATLKAIYPHGLFTLHPKQEVKSLGTESDSLYLKDGASDIELKEKDIYLMVYPMFSPDKREEAKKLPIKIVEGHYGDNLETICLLEYAVKNEFADGAASMVFDRENKIIYACRSEHLNEDLLKVIAGTLNYRYFLFDAIDAHSNPIFHTNLMLSIGKKFAFICLEAVKDDMVRKGLKNLLTEMGKEIIEISKDQMYSFLGNIIELYTKKDLTQEPLYVMSAKAKAALTEDQLNKIKDYALILSPDISNIETSCGRSVDCMMVEMF